MIKLNLIFILALSVQSVYLATIAKRSSNHYNPQQGFRTLSYDSAPQRTFATNTFVSKQAPAIIAAPLSDSGFGGQQQQTVVQQQSGGYGQSNQIVTPVATQTVQSSGYGNAVPIVTPTVTPSSDNYGQQVQVQLPVAETRSSYSQQIVPVPTVVQSSYGQQPAVQVVAPVSSGYGSAAPTGMSPMTLFMSQPAIQQLIATMVSQYHGNQLGVAAEMPNTCSIGFTQPIYESNQVTETYCRCPTGTYGFTCTENFDNPCMDGSVEFTAADSRVPSNYFLKCSWGIPYLNKCPAGTSHWSQELHACVSDEQPVQSYNSGYSSYGGQQNLGKTNFVAQSNSGYGQQAPAATFGNFGQRVNLGQSGNSY
jgi:hypothetical protein